MGLLAVTHQTIATASSENLHIIDQDDQNTYALHGNNLKTWVTRDCANILEGLGAPRRDGTWDADLRHLTLVSLGCDALKTKLKPVSDPKPDPDPSAFYLIDQDDRNTYALHGNNLKTWVTRDCASILEDLGAPRRAGTWDADLRDRTQVSLGCDALKTKLKPDPDPDPVTVPTF